MILVSPSESDLGGFLFKVSLGVECGSAAHPGCGNRLAIDLVSYVASGENPRNGSAGGSAFNDYVTILVRIDLAVEERGLRIAADGDEDAVGGDLLLFAGLHVLDGHGLGGLVFAVDGSDDGIENEVDFLVVSGPVHLNLRSAELITTMDDGDRAAKASQEEGVSQGCIAPAHNDDGLFAEEAPIACGAVGDTAAGKFHFSRHPQFAIAGAGGDKDDLSLIGLPVVGGDRMQGMF